MYYYRSARLLTLNGRPICHGFSSCVYSDGAAAGLRAQASHSHVLGLSWWGKLVKRGFKSQRLLYQRQIDSLGPLVRPEPLREGKSGGRKAEFTGKQIRYRASARPGTFMSSEAGHNGDIEAPETGSNTSYLQRTLTQDWDPDQSMGNRQTSQ